MDVKKKSLTLKVEKALKNMSEDFDSDDEECDDKELSSVTKTLKKFWKRSQRGERNLPPNVAEVK